MTHDTAVQWCASVLANAGSGLEKSDATPAWAGIVVAVVAVLALIVAGVSATLAWRSLRWERLSAEAAGRSAEAAERANRLTERVLEARGQTLERPEEQSPSTAAPDVAWRIENPSKDRFVLRNVGTDIAEHVEVDNTQIDSLTRNLPRDAVIRPGEGIDMLLAAAWGHPLPNQVYVRWEGHPEWEAVPLVVVY
jgi:hypothetical protein